MFVKCLILRETTIAFICFVQHHQRQVLKLLLMSSKKILLVLLYIDSMLYSQIHKILVWQSLMGIYAKIRMLRSTNWEIQRSFIILINQIALRLMDWMIARNILLLGRLWISLGLVLRNRLECCYLTIMQFVLMLV